MSRRDPAVVRSAILDSPRHTWLAGPRLGKEAETLYRNMGRAYGGR
ncbi:hypothetical protein ABZ467_26350 [Streptomyces sp. NPDC005727]